MIVRSRHSLGGFVALLLLIPSSLQGGAEQRPTFKSDVDLVAINVVVIDTHGRTVTNLTEDRFQVSEDDRPQRITQFTRDPLPLSIAVALDTSGSMHGDRFRYARQAIFGLVDHLASEDEIAIVGFSDRPYPITSWTSSRNMVVMALSDERPMAGGFTAIFDAVHVGLDLLDTAAARRRALIVISDGNDELPDAHAYRDGDKRPVNIPALPARDRRRKVIDEVTRSEGLVYAVGISDPRGFEEPLDERTLKSLTDPTGGFTAIIHANVDVPSAVERVLNDLRDQYLVGFTPVHPADGQFHKLTVTVRGCDCRARARSGYVHSRQ